MSDGRKVRLAERVVQALRGGIENGRLKPGARLPTEPELEAEFGVSRTVVREALAELRASGFVTPVQGKGVFVAEPAATALIRLSPVELGNIPRMLEMLEFRTATEGEAAAIAAHRRTAEQEATIRAAHRRMGRLIGEGRPTVEADFEFHRAVAQATNNRYYSDLLEQFGQNAIPRAQFATLPETADPAYLQRIHAEHGDIVEAITDQDAERARQAMRTHLVGAQRRYRALAEQ